MYNWQNHNLTSRYDFHSYMIRSMEEEFKRIVGVRLVEVFDVSCLLNLIEHLYSTLVIIFQLILLNYIKIFMINLL